MKKPEKISIDMTNSTVMNMQMSYNDAIEEMNLWIAHKLERVLDKSDVEHSIKELIKEVKDESIRSI